VFAAFGMKTIIIFTITAAAAATAAAYVLYTGIYVLCQIS